VLEEADTCFVLLLLEDFSHFASWITRSTEREREVRDGSSDNGDAHKVTGLLEAWKTFLRRNLEILPLGLCSASPVGSHSDFSVRGQNDGSNKFGTHVFGFPAFFVRESKRVMCACDSMKVSVV
jgi:hypothetical protein